LADKTEPVDIYRLQGELRALDRLQKKLQPRELPQVES
jgi:hypothetical protein